MIRGKISWKAKYFSVRFSCYSNHQTFYQPFLGDNIQRNMIGTEIIGNAAPLTWGSSWPWLHPGVKDIESQSPWESLTHVSDKALELWGQMWSNFFHTWIFQQIEKQKRTCSTNAAKKRKEVEVILIGLFQNKRDRPLWWEKATREPERGAFMTLASWCREVVWSCMYHERNIETWSQICA